jgi:putative transposase
VVDDFSRECLASKPGRSVTGRDVVAVLQRITRLRGAPETILSDNGASFAAGPSMPRPMAPAFNYGSFDPVSPSRVENAYVESFNGRCRDECLNEHLFVMMDEAPRELERWRSDYNTARPHSSLGKLTPEEFAQQHRVSNTALPESVRRSVA